MNTDNLLKKLKIAEFCKKKKISPNNITFINLLLSPTHFFLTKIINLYIHLYFLYVCYVILLMDL